MSAVAYISARFVGIGSNGLPAAAGQLFTYQNRTTTPQATYQDAAGAMANTNPVILDSAGSATVFLIAGASYTFVLKDALGNVLWTLDDITGQAASVDISALQAAVQLGIQPWSPTPTYAAKSIVERSGVTYYAVQGNTNKDPATDDGSNWKQWGFTLAQLTALGYLTQTAGDARYQLVGNASNVSKVPVRQTTLTGPTDSNGLPNWLPATSGSLSISTQNVSASAPLVFTAAGGSTTQGDENRTSTPNTAGLTWSGLASGSTNYLYVDIDTSGGITTGSTTIAPVYQFGGTYNIGNGAWTFNIQDMTGKLGNGTTASKVYRCFVGEAVAAGSTVTSTVVYAHLARYTAPMQTINVNNTYTFSANIGVYPFDVRVKFRADSSHGFAEMCSFVSTDSAVPRGIIFGSSDRNTAKINTASSNITPAFTSFAANGATTGDCILSASRGW